LEVEMIIKCDLDIPPYTYKGVRMDVGNLRFPYKPDNLTLYNIEFIFSASESQGEISNKKQEE